VDITITAQKPVSEFLQVAQELVTEVREWANVLWVRVQGLRPRFVSKKVMGEKISLLKAQDIYGDPEAIKRGYIDQQVVDFAYELAKEIKSLGLVTNGVGNAHPYWMTNSKTYAQIDSTIDNTRQFTAICEIAEYLAKN
jgi:hypothetical protein